jgi:hypothetical protein
MDDTSAPPLPEVPLWEELPAPDRLRRYEAAHPGSTAWFLREASRMYRHRRRQRTAQRLITLTGYVFALAALVFLGRVAMHFADCGAPREGAAIVGAGAVAIVGIFVTGRRTTERRNPRP